MLTGIAYHNGDSVQYTYDTKGRLLQEAYENGDTVTYIYDNSGSLATVKDSQSGITTKNFYDLTDRLMKYTETASGFSHSVQYTYDTKNNMTGVTEDIDGRSTTTSYTYDIDNRVTGISDGIVSEHYTYDKFGRVYLQQTRYAGSPIKNDTFTFEDLYANEYTSAQIATHKVEIGNFSKTYSYTYDRNGNIASINDGTYITSYVYDSANQLVRENNQKAGFTKVWTYDNRGNITACNTYAYTTGSTLGNPTDTDTFAYNDSQWGNWLSSYNGETIVNDNLGNLINERNNWFYTWKHGRQLATMSNGTTTWSYTYDANGMRTMRTNGSRTYTYVYNGSQLTKMTVHGKTMYFFYDATGAPLMVNMGGNRYYYVTNLQGDVVAIVDSTGTTIAEYTYDAWGNQLSVTCSETDDFGIWNPLRYRGYVYDQETCLYYLESRYYAPCYFRFISPDAFTSTGQGFTGNNMFAYCNNNPVNYVDRDGEYAEALQWWTANMWWLCAADATLPIGEIVYVSGVFSLGVVSLVSEGINRITKLPPLYQNGADSNDQQGEVTTGTPPTEKDGYQAPRGGPKKGKTKDGKTGWIDKHGNIWVPAPTGTSRAHGGGHWDVQRGDSKGYSNVYPGGRIRPGSGKSPTLPLIK